MPNFPSALITIDHSLPASLLAFISHFLSATSNPQWLPHLRPSVPNPAFLHRFPNTKASAINRSTKQNTRQPNLNPGNQAHHTQKTSTRVHTAPEYLPLQTQSSRSIPSYGGGDVAPRCVEGAGAWRSVIYLRDGGEPSPGEKKNSKLVLGQWRRARMLCRPGGFSLVVEEAVAERKETLTNPRPPLGAKCFPRTYGAPIATETALKSLRREEGA